MPFFRPQTRTYEAIQFERVEFAENGAVNIHFDTSEGLPEWLCDALIDGQIVAKQGESYLISFIEDTEVHIHPTDWIMYQEDVGVFVISGNELLEDFEPVPVTQNATVQVTGVEAHNIAPFEGAPI